MQNNNRTLVFPQESKATNAWGQCSNFSNGQGDGKTKYVEYQFNTEGQHEITASFKLKLASDKHLRFEENKISIGDDTLFKYPSCHYK